jgi:hypothetical protein
VTTAGRDRHAYCPVSPLIPEVMIEHPLSVVGFPPGDLPRKSDVVRRRQMLGSALCQVDTSSECKLGNLVIRKEMMCTHCQQIPSEL